MNRFPAFAALAFALSTLCACDPAQVIPHMAKGSEQLAAPAPQVCTVAAQQDEGCPPPAQLPNTNH